MGQSQNGVLRNGLMVFLRCFNIYLFLTTFYNDTFRQTGLTLYSIDNHFDASTTLSFENIVGKGEIARNEQLLLFPQCFLLNEIIVSPFVHIFDIISLIAAEFEEPKIGI